MNGMRTIIVAIALLSGADAAHVVTPQDEKESIEQVIENWNRGWQTKDASLASRDYSEDADWTNAFGMRKTGRVEIEKFLADVFSLAFVMAGKSSVI